MSDIRGTLEQIRNRLNELLGIDVPRAGDWVILSNLVDPQGQPVPEAENKVSAAERSTVNLDLLALNALMSLAGANYLPSVYYKVRLI